MLKLNLVNITGKLPTSIFDLIDGENKIGFIQIRHQPSHGQGVPENFSSHVYYETESEYRGKGYGKEILKLGINEAKRIGLKGLFLTCFDDNISSRKIIEANGGKLVDFCLIEGNKFLKFVIEI